MLLGACRPFLPGQGLPLAMLGHDSGLFRLPVFFSGARHREKSGPQILLKPYCISSLLSFSNFLVFALDQLAISPDGFHHDPLLF